MTTSFALRTASGRLLMLVLVALCFFPQRAGAQSTNIDVYVWVNPVGLSHGQTLIYTWANLNDPDPRKREFEPLSLEVKLLGADGSVIAQDQAAAVAVGHSQSFAFDRDLISLPGEAGTGRLQVRLEVSVHIQRRNLVTTTSFDNLFADAAEVIDNLSGQTTSVVPSLGGNNDSISSGFGNDYLIGIVLGQTLSITLFKPNDPDSTEPTNVVAKLYDAGGRVIAQSGEVVIPAGQFRSIAFNRSSLNLPGEPGTGRLQVRMVVEGTFNLTFTGQTTSVPLSASWELVNNATGRTTSGTQQSGHFTISFDRPIEP